MFFSGIECPGKKQEEVRGRFCWVGVCGSAREWSSSASGQLLWDGGGKDRTTRKGETRGNGKLEHWMRQRGWCSGRSHDGCVGKEFIEDEGKWGEMFGGPVRSGVVLSVVTGSPGWIFERKAVTQRTEALE